MYLNRQCVTLTLAERIRLADSLSTFAQWKQAAEC